tara:strand:- start:111 stop:689 length:579 start_codon:yes stop_codon:yes gene_type:complete
MSLYINKIFLVLSALFSFLISCNSQSEVIIEDSVLKPEIVEVYLLDALNDSRKYCLDIIGYKTNADINKGLQVHSCYSYQGEISVDQGFDKSRIDDNEFYIPLFKACMEAVKIEKSSRLELKNCDKNQKQEFIFQNDGKIQPLSNLNLCLTASENFREGGGGNPVHLIRDLSLQICDDTFSSRQKWSFRKIN